MFLNESYVIHSGFPCALPQSKVLLTIYQILVSNVPLWMMILKDKPRELEGKFYLNEIDGKMRSVLASQSYWQKIGDSKEVELTVVPVCNMNITV